MQLIKHNYLLSNKKCSKAQKCQIILFHVWLQGYVEFHQSSPLIRNGFIKISKWVHAHNFTCNTFLRVSET